MTSLFDSTMVDYANRVVSRPRAKPRATIACVKCRKRKVRCNLVQHGPPCINCKLDGVECTVSETHRNRLRKEILPPYLETASDMRRMPRASSSSSSGLVANEGSVNAGEECSVLETGGVEESLLFCLPESRAQTPCGSALAGNSIVNSDSCYSARSTCDVSGQYPRLASCVKPIRPGLSQLDIEYLERKGAFHVPDGSMREALIANCLRFVGYFMPCLDWKDCPATDKSNPGAPGKEENNGRISLLLLQAMMFAGSSFVDISLLKAYGYETRKVARDTFYHRTKVLYELDVEDDQLAILQAILLMSFWCENPEDKKDAWHWTGAAVSLVQVLGLGETASSLDLQSREFKRMWWSCCIRDTHVALAMRLPPRLKNPISVLTLDDFEGLRVDGKDIIGKHRQRAMICIEMSKLCICITDVLSTHDLPGMRRSDAEIHLIDAKLRNWIKNLGHECRPTIGQAGEGNIVTDADEKSCAVSYNLLLMTYYAALSTLHLAQVLPSTPQPESQRVPNPATSHSYKSIQLAARTISLLADDAVKQGLVPYFPNQGITCVLPTVSIHLLNLKSCNVQVRESNIQRLQYCVQFLRELGQRYIVLDQILQRISVLVKHFDISTCSVSSSSHSEEADGRPRYGRPGVVHLQPLNARPQSQTDMTVPLSPFTGHSTDKLKLSNGVQAKGPYPIGSNQRIFRDPAMGLPISPSVMTPPEDSSLGYFNAPNISYGKIITSEQVDGQTPDNDLQYQLTSFLVPTSPSSCRADLGPKDVPDYPELDLPWIMGESDFNDPETWGLDWM